MINIAQEESEQRDKILEFVKKDNPGIETVAPVNADTPLEFLGEAAEALGSYVGDLETAVTGKPQQQVTDNNNEERGLLKGRILDLFRNKQEEAA